MTKTYRTNDVTAREDERGFTLIELLITLVILPVVMGGLVLMLLLVFNVQNGVTNKLSGAVDAQVTTQNLQTDVQNAAYVTTSTTPSCGSSGYQVLGTETDGNTVIVSYDVVQAGSKYELVRYSCSSSNVATPTSKTTLSNDVNWGSRTTLVSVSASGSTTGGWDAAGNVATVALSITEPHTGVSYSLTSTPRAWTPVSTQSGGSPVPDITLLGTNSSTNNCSDAALTLGSDSSITYGGGDDEVVWAPDSCTSTSVQNSSSWNGDSESYSSWGSTWGYGGTSTGSGSSPDPLSGTTQPTYGNPTGSGSCSGNSCSSGTNSTTTSITGPCTFGNGTYVFTQPVTISGGCTFGSGTYVFEGGVTCTGSGTCNLGSGTFICGGNSSSSSSTGFSCTGSCKCSCESTGCEIYCTDGCNFSNTGGTDLCGTSANNGVCVYDTCSSSSKCVSLCGSTSSSTTCNYGGVYCPNGQVSCTSGKCTSSFVDCGSLNVENGSTLCAG
jgi:prepilin-type N-terminal cleavage/methylation domain-containing protein